METRRRRPSSRGESGDVDNPPDTEKKSDVNNTSTLLNQVQDNDGENEVASSQKSVGVLDKVMSAEAKDWAWYVWDLAKNGLSRFVYLAGVTWIILGFYGKIEVKDKIDGLEQVALLLGLAAFIATGIYAFCRQSVFVKGKEEAQK